MMATLLNEAWSSPTRPSWQVGYHYFPKWYAGSPIQDLRRGEDTWPGTLTLHWFRGCEVGAESLGMLEVKSFFGEYWVLLIPMGRKQYSLISSPRVKASQDWSGHTWGCKDGPGVEEVGGVGLLSAQQLRPASTTERFCRPDVAHVERELACHHLCLLKG